MPILVNKTIHFLGNSVSRIWAFALYNKIARASKSFETARDMCGTGKNSAAGETCVLRAFSTVIKLTWTQEIWSETVRSSFLEPADIIIFSMGSDYW